jgi:hypothetical protein
MKRTVDVRHISRVLIFVLLLTSTFALALADDPNYSKLTYGDGKEYQTTFFDARLLGELPVPVGEPILVFTGRSSLPCDPPDCDSETSVYFQWASEPPDRWTGSSASYPGNYYAKETGKLVARVRMFVGRCIDSREGVAWFIENFEGKAKQARTVLRSQVRFEFVNDGPPGSLLYGRMMTEFPAHARITTARSAVARHACREVTPQPRISRLAAEYVGMEMPDLNLLFNGGAPPKTINKWMRYQITLPPNHPWPIILFSTQEFKLTGAGNESLVLLADLEYKKLEEMTDVQSCSATLPPQYRGGGRITKYDNGNAIICWLSQTDACQYLTAISTSPGIHWTAEQSRLIHGLSWDTECKDSGWWEYQEKFRHDAEAWAKSHPDDSNQTNLPASKQSPEPDR